MQISQGQALGEAFFAEDVLGQGFFLFLEFADFFFDAVFDEQAVGDDFLGLADAVGAVDGLVFDGGVPPGIEEDDVAGGSQVQAEAAGFEGDEEDARAFGGLEFLDEVAAVFSVAGEVKGGPTSFVERGLEEVQELDELGEDEDLLAFVHEGLELFEEGFGLGAGRGGVGFDEARMTTDLAQAQERGEKMELLLGEFFLGFDAQEELLGALEFGAVEGLLFAFDFAEEVFFDAVGQIPGDLTLGAAQEEGPDARGQAAAGKGIAFGVVEFGKLGAAAEDAGHGKGHEAPEVAEAILDGGAAQDQAMVGVQSAGDLRGLGAGIFDVLAFVENEGLPLDRDKGFAKQPELIVVDDVDVGGVELFREIVEFGSGPVPDADRRREFRSFGVPVVHDAFGADDQAGPGSG